MSNEKLPEEKKFTPGPWRWEVNRKSKIVELCGGKPRYDLTVMDFVRWGTQGAKPRFLTNDGMMILLPVEYYTAPIEGREHHANWCATINHPDARLIAAAPDMYEALENVAAYFDTAFVADGARNITLENTVKKALAKATNQ